MVKRLISQGTRGYLNLGEVLGRKRRGPSEPLRHKIAGILLIVPSKGR